MAVDNGEPPPSATVYVKNLSEKPKIPALIEALREVFEEFGTIVDIVAKKNLKAKGQAFVVYDSVESAGDAIEELQDFDLFEKPMSLAYARTRSDTTVKREDDKEKFEQHKKHRLAEKERKQALEAANQKPAKRPATDGLAERPAKSAKPAPSAAGGLVPDEYLPPNRTIVLQNLPEDYTKDNIAIIFSRFPGYKEVRTVPGRKGLAFVEYEDENASITAKEETSGMTLGENVVKVTYQRQ
ncbi:hypothetical protein LTR37_012430 [Vermiconidia calcicola]|uniref:Uncharacterized protein n=1 Tax=Vermiconidia calcicola TaxID=1690605 RepID=A0ACC3MZ84_9PEZI|nr:hypothetical protein LTR37_012430 [Vermiconidia calcicola]